MVGSVGSINLCISFSFFCPFLLLMDKRCFLDGRHRVNNGDGGENPTAQNNPDDKTLQLG